jgi:DNA polymerase-3 subunit epsilon
MNTFTAIDFETAQPKRNSVCQIGMVRYENGKIVETYNQLIQPPDNFYWGRFTDIHGISPQDTRYAPLFPEVWEDVKRWLDGQNVVAHNGAFDFNVLSQTLTHYDLAQIEYKQHCTYKIFKSKLNILCNTYGIPLNHHDALSDAIACGELFKIHLSTQ